jgi:hypothetical protein
MYEKRSGEEIGASYLCASLLSKPSEKRIASYTKSS